MVDFNRNCFVKHVRSIYIHKKVSSLVTMPTGIEKPTKNDLFLVLNYVSNLLLISILHYLFT